MRIKNNPGIGIRAQVHVGPVILYGQEGDRNTVLALQILDCLGVQYGFAECNQVGGCLTRNGLITETPTLTGLPEPSDRWEGQAVFEGLARSFLKSCQQQRLTRG